MPAGPQDGAVGPDDDGVRPALVVGMPVGFVSAAESKDLMAQIADVPWIVIRGRKGGSTLVVAALHALLALADERLYAAKDAGRDRVMDRPRTAS